MLGLIHTQRSSHNAIEALGALRARIAKIEGHTQSLNADVEAKAWTSGLVELDAALGNGSGGVLNLGALHEIMPASPVHLPVASAFAFGLIARLPRRGPIFWCMSSLGSNEHGAPYAPGLAAFGIDPSRVINVHVRHPRDLSFVLEEATRLPVLAAVIAEGPSPSFTASRRLALLLAASHVPLLFLGDGKADQGSAAATRFVVSPLAAGNTSLDNRSPGPPAFHVTLARTRGGRPGLQFEMVFDHANRIFAPYSRAQPDSIPGRQLSLETAPEQQQRA